MMIFPMRLSVLALALLFGLTASASDSLYVAFWNVENLFDTVDDLSLEGDEEFTPEGEKKWTGERLRIKLHNLARVIRDMNGGAGPDVLGLCEVENREVIEMLVRTIDFEARDYRIVHHDSPSGRGIDCALLYDATCLRLGPQPRFYRVNTPKPTREIVETEFVVKGQSLHVFVNHWPSRGNPEEQRIAAADRLRQRIDEILEKDANADVVILGDLNDTPVNKSVGSHLKTWSDPSDLYPGVFFNSTWPIYKDPNRGTYVYRNRWNLLDHVILSPGLLHGEDLRWRPGSTDTVQREYQMFHPDSATQIPRPSRSFSWNSFHEDGYSDHLPVRCVLEYVPSSSQKATQ